MPIITLPTGGYVEAVPRFIDFSTHLTPNMGGEDQQIIRPGSRFGIEITLPRKAYAQIGDAGAMKWISRLNQAKHGEALYPFPQPGLSMAAPGVPRVNGAGQQGSILNADGFNANWAWREGQFLSIIHQGNRYLHMLSADGQANPAGIAALPLFPMLRIEPDDNALIEIAAPMIQGKIEGDASEWTIDYIRTCGLAFAIVEKR
jgi:hypothetical protein